MPTCPSCNTPYIDHLGIIGTCAKLQDLRTVAKAAHSAWLDCNAERLAPDLSNHYTARQLATDYTHAMLRLGAALEQLEKQ